MLDLDLVEQGLRWIGGLAALGVLASVFYGIGRGLGRPAAGPAGRLTALLRSPAFYLLTSLAYFGLCYLLWRPVIPDPAPPQRLALLAAGSLLYFGGLALVLWGRLALGKFYFVSSGFGAPLFQDHNLVDAGPYAIVRHPMYLGILLASLGGILFYRTWTLVFFLLIFPGLVNRARREEKALVAWFGPAYLDYCRRVPAWLPSWHPQKLGSWLVRLPDGPSALIEVGLLFLPAIPAYLWLWPNVEGDARWLAQALVYAYVLAGIIFIGRRRWGWGELGLNPRGLRLSLACALALLLGRLLIIVSVDWKLAPPPLDPGRLVLEVLYYFGLVALVEELLFRGLVYRALEGWSGDRAAIWGSSFGFMLWHIFGQGPVIGLTTFVIGLVFALLRWRAGGILGLIGLHALWDLQSALLVPSLGDSVQILARGRPAFNQPALVGLGTALLVLVPLYLWLVYPRLKGRFGRPGGGSTGHLKEA